MNELGDRFDDVLQRASAGDRSAFAELWRSAHPGLMRYLRVVCGDDLADDVASEAWLRVINGLNGFRGQESDFRGWIAVIARNHAIDLGRRATRRGEQLVSDLPDGGRDPAPDTADVAGERLATSEALELVRTLPPAVAEMVLLRVVVGLDVAQVAQIVDRTPGAVRVAVHRGLRTLAQTLSEQHAAGTSGPGV